MKVLFYHNILTQGWKESLYKGEFPKHLLYGATHLSKFGIEVEYCSIPFDPYRFRFRLMLYNLFAILFSKKQFDLIYAATHRGLELLILLRALGVYRKPIVIWHHTAVVNPVGRIRGLLSKWFYKGIDHFFFFSEPLLERSLATGKVNKEQATIIHWGADLDYYDQLRKERKIRTTFISTGRENRDFKTLLEALSKTNYECEIYTGGNLLNDIEIKTLPNTIHLYFAYGTPIEMAKHVSCARVVLISSYDLPYTVGLTTLVEALALGLPVITTNNKNYPFDVESEGVGINIPFGNVDAWIKALNYISSHPEEAEAMGKRGRILAENLYNLDHFSQEIACILRQVCCWSVEL